MCLLMLSNGTPMFSGGDEFLVTRGGNNNPYNQDNDINYTDWELLEINRDFFRFVRGMIAFRREHPSVARSHFWREDVRWYGTGKEVDLSPGGQTLAWCLSGASQHDNDIYVMVNASPNDVNFEIQEGAASHWRLVADTGLPAPHDYNEPENRRALLSPVYRVGARSVVVLCSVDS
jgi:glycogen operon protein